MEKLDYFTEAQRNSYQHLIVQGYKFSTIILNQVYMIDRNRIVKIDKDGTVRPVQGEVL